MMEKQKEFLVRAKAMYLTLIALVICSSPKEILKNAKTEIQTFVMIERQKGGANAMMGVVLGGVFTVFVGAIMIYAGLFGVATLRNALPGVNDSNYNASLASVSSNVNSAFTILGVVLIFVGIGAILAAVMGFIPGGRTPGR